MDNFRAAEDCQSKECKGKDCAGYQKPLPLDLVSTLHVIDDMLDKLADVAGSKSASYGDRYCILEDKIIDIRDGIQVTLKDAVEIAKDEADTLPIAPKVGMDHNG